MPWTDKAWRRTAAAGEQVNGDSFAGGKCKTLAISAACEFRGKFRSEFAWTQIGIGLTDFRDKGTVVVAMFVLRITLGRQ
jgi:hypothetical protein